tara:strand:+ start:80 stop:616 length:537 start_codon:yes stop_codon:yes gene_type:complete
MMIIKCDNCIKSFNINSSLIPEKGRLLQCNACNHKWFFKKEITEKSIPIAKTQKIEEVIKVFNNDVTKVETEIPKTIELLERETEDAPVIEKISTENNNEKKENIRKNKKLNINASINKKSYNILGLTIVLIISFIAIIIVLDTFQKPISFFIPNIEFILYNLYETINDIVLFFNDLI